MIKRFGNISSLHVAWVCDYMICETIGNSKKHESDMNYQLFANSMCGGMVGFAKIKVLLLISSSS